MKHKAVDLIVSGYVQGVGFRRLCAEHAWSIGAKGWVRNRFDGRVEVHIEGSQDQIDDLIRWCESGPRWGTVDRVSVNPGVFENLTGFSIK